MDNCNNNNNNNNIINNNNNEGITGRNEEQTMPQICPPLWAKETNERMNMARRAKWWRMVAHGVVVVVVVGGGGGG